MFPCSFICPHHPESGKRPTDLRALWHAVESQQVTHFGASPKFFGACRSAQVSPREEGLNLGSMRSILSTGSPLLPEHYDFIYKSVKEDVHLASISGGTDILGCFMLGQVCKNFPQGSDWRFV
jgi:acetoacetyl-CoA synthetase